MSIPFRRDESANVGLKRRISLTISINIRGYLKENFSILYFLFLNFLWMNKIDFKDRLFMVS